VKDDGGKPERGAPVISWLLWPGELAAGGRASWVFFGGEGSGRFWGSLEGVRWGALAGLWRKPEEEGEQGRLWLFWFSSFLLPNERGMAGPNREREAWPWLLVLGASFKMPGAAGWYVRRRK